MLIILEAMASIGGDQSWECHRYGDELRWLEGDLRLEQDSLPGLGRIFHDGAHMRYTFRFDMRRVKFDPGRHLSGKKVCQPSLP